MARDFIAPLAPEAPQAARAPRKAALRKGLVPERTYCAEPECGVWLQRSEYVCKRHTPKGY